MNQGLRLLLLLDLAICLVACVEQPVTPATAPGATPAPTGAAVTPTRGATVAPPATAVSSLPSAAPTSAGTPASLAYQDDRSGPDVLVQSYVNAINLKQYVRAYSYWESGAQLPTYAQFEQGFANKSAVQLTLGAITSGVGAGQMYFSVPAVLASTQSNNTAQTAVACYVLHESRPELQEVPPFNGLRIQSAKSQPVQGQVNTAALLVQACADTAGGGPPYTPPAFEAADISADRYLDDRSDAVQVLRSLFNAVNAKQYTRAYSYWETGQAPPFPQFQQGYATTEWVQLTTGTVKSDAGAGQIFYRVPVKLVATSTSNTTQTFVGCYTLHLARPEIQGTPPFQPLGVRSAQVQSVPNNADTTSLMNQACP